MAHEFPEEELLECTSCGMVLPYGMMTFTEDGAILCPDCYDELTSALQDSGTMATDDPEPVEPLSQFDSALAQVEGWSDRLSFIAQLPENLKNKFIRRINSGGDPFSDTSLMSRTDGIVVSSFVAVDVETANSYPSSICSVGMVFVKNGKVTDRFHSLVHPEPDYYEFACRRVHGLGPEDTDNAPNFRKVWNKVRNRVREGGVPLIAHNARFDENCLRAAFLTYGMTYPDYRFLDTLKASRRHFGSTLPNHQLQTVAKACGFDLKHHHDALSDAEACAAIALKIMPLRELLRCL